MLFSIVTVSYNAGEKLLTTINSVLNQTYSNFQVVVKDGGSSDGSLELIPADDHIKVIKEKDKGIYDAMNMAIEHVEGEYVIFLNCGDTFYSDSVLQEVADLLERCKYENVGFLYGDFYYKSRDALVSYPDTLSDKQLFSRTICHQSIFFATSLFETLRYEYEKYPYAADMGLYIASVKKLGKRGIHIPTVVCNYEGEGVSDRSGIRKKIRVEKKRIMQANFSRKDYIRLKIWKILTLKEMKEFVGTIAWLKKPYEWIAGKYARMNRA